jgi:2-polyprenyl-3-methyl-5-hydroxy-6-metoxy-1,4-benzoquinol methylase
MTTRQQEEILLYFSEHAREWKDRAASADEQKANITRQRKGFVLFVIQHRTTTRSALDVGCGTGDLVCDIAGIGIDATGVDFSWEMIDIARNRGGKQERDQAHFHCSSIFDFALTQRRYDVISALSNLLQNYGHEHLSLVPYSSSFMIHVERSGRE